MLGTFGPDGTCLIPSKVREPGSKNPGQHLAVGFEFHVVQGLSSRYGTSPVPLSFCTCATSPSQPPRFSIELACETRLSARRFPW